MKGISSGNDSFTRSPGPLRNWATGGGEAGRQSPQLLAGGRGEFAGRDTSERRFSIELHQRLSQFIWIFSRGEPVPWRRSLLRIGRQRESIRSAGTVYRAAARKDSTLTRNPPCGWGETLFGPADSEVASDPEWVVHLFSGRQQQSGLPPDRLGRAERAAVMAPAQAPMQLAVGSEALEPVSYTHLDVYKRQHLCRAVPRFL